MTNGIRALALLKYSWGPAEHNLVFIPMLILCKKYKMTLKQRWSVEPLDVHGWAAGLNLSFLGELIRPF